jgi:hypothetical protein
MQAAAGTAGRENLIDHPAVYLDCAMKDPHATWHSAGRGETETPDLMLWLGDPEGEPPTFEIGVVLLRNSVAWQPGTPAGASSSVSRASRRSTRGTPSARQSCGARG